MSKRQIVINVHGGIVQDVFCSDPEAQLTVVDWDTKGQDAAISGTVQVTIGGRKVLAGVSRGIPVPISELVRTAVGQAIAAFEPRNTSDQLEAE